MFVRNRPVEDRLLQLWAAAQEHIDDLEINLYSVIVCLLCKLVIGALAAALMLFPKLEQAL
jgi:hypothetical protein